MKTERGVTAVVGKILIVAITIALGASIAVFAIGIGDSTSGPEPKVAAEVEQRDDGTIQTSHLSGDPIQSDDIDVRGGTLVDPPDEITPGDIIEIEPSPLGGEVAVIWKAGQPSRLGSVEVNGDPEEAVEQSSSVELVASVDGELIERMDWIEEGETAKICNPEDAGWDQSVRILGGHSSFDIGFWGPTLSPGECEEVVAQESGRFDLGLDDEPDDYGEEGDVFLQIP